MDERQQNGFFIIDDPFKEDTEIESFLSLDDFKKVLMTILLGQRDNNIYMKGLPVCITQKKFQGTYDFSVQGLVRSRHKADKLEDILLIISNEYGESSIQDKEGDAGDN